MGFLLNNPFPSGVYSLRFRQAGTATANFSDNNWLFTIPADLAGVQTGENPTMSPAENGVLLGAFTATLTYFPLTNDTVTFHWTESAVAKVATVDSVGSIGGANAASLSAASVNRTTGAISLTFNSGHAPGVNSITVDYTPVGITSVGTNATRQGWSKAFRITAATQDLEISFDGVNVHGKIKAGAEAHYFDRYEGGIAVRGNNSVFVVEAW